MSLLKVFISYYPDLDYTFSEILFINRATGVAG